MIKVATTEQLRAINKAIEAMEGERPLHEQTLTYLDPDGLHVLQQLMYHESPQGDTIRCRLLMKFDGEHAPKVIHVYNVPPEMFAKLPEWEEESA